RPIRPCRSKGKEFPFLLLGVVSSSRNLGSLEGRGLESPAEEEACVSGRVEWDERLKSLRRRSQHRSEDKEGSRGHGVDGIGRGTEEFGGGGRRRRLYDVFKEAEDLGRVWRFG
ncbi:hypothetical protein LINGRAHAP2_LOCUS34502, partial [Linum grandiflorum]